MSSTETLSAPTPTPAPLAPITESPNELTGDIDLATPLEMARLLRQSDAQIFSGYGGLPSVIDEPVVNHAVNMARQTAKAIAAGEKGAVVISGAGTSGRLAWFLSRNFNRRLRTLGAAEVFRPLLAGGAHVLVKSLEGVEDDPKTGVTDLNAVLNKGVTADDAAPGETNKPGPNLSHIVYVGITCGLSAAYTAGQVNSLLNDSRASVVLLGFNPLDRARRLTIEGWDRTFADIVEAGLKAAEQDPARFIPLVPVYGPEAIKGSTRMKGGSTTKLLLEAVFSLAMEIAGMTENAPVDEDSSDAVLVARLRAMLLSYQRAITAVYTNTEQIGEMIRLGGAALRCGGQISYIGRDTAGFLGILDASECPPTFGAHPRDVRGYIRSGWPELLDEERDFTYKGPDYAISHEAFEKDRLEDLSRGDFVLGIAIGEVGPSTLGLIEAATESRASVALLLVGKQRPSKENLPKNLEHFFFVEVPELGFAPDFHNVAELALKLCLNAVSTGAHVLVGRVYHNQMIDLRISNTKLYHRAIGTIAQLAETSEELAREAVHRAAFRKDTLSAEEQDALPSAIIKLVGDRSGVVPLALLLAIGGTTVEDGQKALAADPVVRRVVEKQLKKKAEGTAAA
ncbi:MAG: hypothetical protein RLY93_04015 [Sumerlaeia bacterium]